MVARTQGGCGEGIEPRRRVCDGVRRRRVRLLLCSCERASRPFIRAAFAVRRTHACTHACTFVRPFAARRGNVCRVREKETCLSLSLSFAPLEEEEEEVCVCMYYENDCARVGVFTLSRAFFSLSLFRFRSCSRAQHGLL